MLDNRTSPDETRAQPERSRSRRPVRLAGIALVAVLFLLVFGVRRAGEPKLEPPF